MSKKKGYSRKDYLRNQSIMMRMEERSEKET